MTTSEKLKNITDRALFERIAASILRVKFPQLANLIEAGVNEKGETIKSPVDGFSKSSNDEFCYIEYTTDDSNLKEKWLHDPQLYKGKKKKDPKPEGDLLKAITEAKKTKILLTESKFTIYLVTNQKVDSDLFTLANKTADNEDVKLEIIELSILSDFLDHTAYGHWIRKTLLGIEAELLSTQLFKDISLKNKKNYASDFSINPKILHTRNEFETILDELNSSDSLVHFITGESGMGKSSLAYWLMDNYISSEKVSLKISPEVVSNSINLETAIFDQLKLHHRNLFYDENQFQSIIKEVSSILIIIDDINTSSNPRKLIEKIISWKSNSIDGNLLRIKIVCPIWPIHFNYFQSATNENPSFTYSSLKEYRDFDSTLHIKNVLVQANIPASKFQIKELSSKLAHDPLLIDLFTSVVSKIEDLNNIFFQSIIGTYIKKNINEIAYNLNVLEINLTESLCELGNLMLFNKNFTPSYEELKSWINPDTLKKLDSLFVNRKLVSISGENMVLFRHDRVRDVILSNSLQNIIKDDVLAIHAFLMSDPYLSNIISLSISKRELKENDIQYLLSVNPTVVFSHLLDAKKGHNNIYYSFLLTMVRKWNLENIKENKVSSSVIHHILLQLFYSDAEDIMLITEHFPEDNHFLHLTRFKNGNTISGLKYLSVFADFEPTYGNKQREETMEHVRSKFYAVTEKNIIKYLFDSQFESSKSIRFLYLLSGYWKSENLAEYIYKSWLKNENHKESNLLYALWAILQCFGEKSSTYAKYILQEWEALQVEGEERSGFPKGIKNNITYSISKCKWDMLNDDQINLLEKFKKRKIGEEIIHNIFYKQDSIVALKYTLLRKAEIKRVAHPHSTASLMISLDKTWSPKDHGKQLSLNSHAFLKTIWSNRKKEKNLRKYSFYDWCDSASQTELLSGLKEVLPADKTLFVESIYKRARVGDYSVEEVVLKLLVKYPRLLSVLPNIWSDKIKCEVEILLCNNKFFDFEDIKDLMNFIPESDAEYYLLKYQNIFGHDDVLLQIALYVATDETRKLAADIFLKSDKKDELFRFTQFTYGCYELGKEEKITIHKLNSLIPYLGYFDESSINVFASQCQRSGYIEWSKNNLYSFMIEADKKDFFPTDDDVILELKEFSLSSKIHWVDDWCKRLEKRGVDYLRFISILSKFAKYENSLFGLMVFGRCLEIIGKRKDIELLDSYCLETGYLFEAEELIRDTKYTIMRNTLI
ncbi:hypothetical protein [Flavobacterium aquicola]|uniref:Uncharacterized protein n=1 Tax=Flavobacterium aquicola TaxID=1682742 RepID=A0A3E0ELP9_9FLAO|nr:hypothetical protein [Flavobacterium aquicola]REG99147.1 hypothetical protein C8P67_105319 [Flavobacterium aquicola]